MTQTPKKILLVQLYANGDCLYATSVARQIKSDFPQCLLTWAVAPSASTILINNPYIDEIMEIRSVARDDVAAFRKFKNLISKGHFGTFDKTFITQVIDSNLANYDGSIRSAIFRGYPNKITVPVQPVLDLLPEEIEKADHFSSIHNLSSYKSVILFEFAPQSGQSKITLSFAMFIASQLTKQDNIAVILSSAQKIETPGKNIFDGSLLSIRDTAALTHHCTHLLGCSSGITWVSTSSSAKLLPMIQLLNSKTMFINSVSRDFMRFGIDNSKVIELYEYDELTVINCVTLAIKDFNDSKKKFNQIIPINFKTTRIIVYNLICYLQFTAILKHIKVNREIYGDRLSFYKQLFFGIFIFPFKFIRNFFIKKVFRMIFRE